MNPRMRRAISWDLLTRCHVIEFAYITYSTVNDVTANVLKISAGLVYSTPSCIYNSK